MCSPWNHRKPVGIMQGVATGTRVHQRRHAQFPGDTVTDHPSAPALRQENFLLGPCSSLEQDRFFAPVCGKVLLNSADLHSSVSLSATLKLSDLLVLGPACTLILV